MKIESTVNYYLNRFPALKRAIKRCYQYGNYLLSPKIKAEGNIVCVSPKDEKEYFFGYYDKSPWDRSGRYMLCMRADNTWADVSPRSPADILLIDLSKGEAEDGRVRKLAQTRSWNVQQGCMAQWLGPDFDRLILYNDFRKDRFCAVVLDVFTGEERVLDMPVYSVSEDGKTALTLDFTRLYSLRPGYGYYNLPERTKGIPLPDGPCIWRMDIATGKAEPLLNYTDFARFEPRKEMLDPEAVHKVNHLMLSPNGKRFMVLYRWFNGQKKYTRLITCNTDGTEMYLLNDDDMTSHCFWKNDAEIIAFANKHGEGTGYYLLKDKTKEYTHLWPALTNDGHPSYSPDRRRVVTDTYPNRARIAEVRVMSDADVPGKNVQTIARVFAPFKYDNDTRCDLHPRWSRDGKQICFDAAFERKRGLYVVSAE